VLPAQLQADGFLSATHASDASDAVRPDAAVAALPAQPQVAPSAEISAAPAQAVPAQAAVAPPAEEPELCTLDAVPSAA
jgi:hypothetical protein